MNSQNLENFAVSIDERGLVRISLNVPSRPVNILNQLVMSELRQIVDELEKCDKAKLAVIESSKKSGFLAGADVNAIVEIDSPDQAMRLLEDGQLLFQRIESLSIPTVAVIHGPCLGGGLELALACDYRIALDIGSTKIGLPEINLGVIPGWGGTQRLPKLIGLTPALGMILQGKQVGARDALKMGLIDQAGESDSWEKDVDSFIRQILARGPVTPARNRLGLTQRLLESNPLGRKLILNAARKRIASKGKNYPALDSALKAITLAFRRGGDGFACERAEFVKLLQTMTCRNLLSLFLARETARNPKTWSTGQHDAKHSPIQKVGVVGAGAMGAGIAQLAALRGFDVVVKEINQETADAGRHRIDGMIRKFAKRKGWSDEKRRQFIDGIVVTCDEAQLADSDLIVEAIVERLDVKQPLFRGLDSLVQPTAILATNTSSLSVDVMADATTRQANFGGLHFFNPVHRMELVEVVRGKRTSEETVVRLVSFVRALGKTPVVTTDSPGFLVNRVLFPYLGEAVLMVLEGFDVARIDKELRRFGMPMGPLELLDQVGIDVAQHVALSLSNVLQGLDAVSETLSGMVDKGQLGKKSGVGFYQYSKGNKGKPSSTSSVPSPVNIGNFADDGLTSIQRRLVYPMLMESIRCLEERVVEESWAVDLAMVLGTGFAPHRGGPLHVVDQIGSGLVSANAVQLSETCGPRFSPPASLIEMARTAARFFEGKQTIEQEAGSTLTPS